MKFTMELTGFVLLCLSLLVPIVHGMALPEDDWFDRMQVDPGYWVSDETGFEPMGKLDKACGGKPADVYFLLDASDEVGEEGFKSALQYVSDLAPTFSDRTRIGVITYADDVFSMIHLGQYQDSAKLQAATLRIPYEGGQPDTGRALRYIRRKAFSPAVARENVAHIVIVVTNGRSRNTKDVIQEAQRVKKTGVYLYAVYPSERADSADLEAIASHPVDNFLFSMKTFNILTSTQEILQTYLCEIQVVPGDGEKKVCDTKRPSDIVFAVDYATIGVKKSKKVLKFVKEAIKVLDVGSDRVNVGVLTNDCPKELDIDLEDHYTRDGVLEDVDSMKLPSQADLLKKARRRSFSRFYGARVNVQQTLVMFVDDKLDNPTRVVQEALRVKAKKIQIIVVAIGSRLKIKNLHRVATGDDSVIQIESYDDLRSAKDNILELVCRGL